MLLLAAETANTLSGRFTLIDWLVVFGYLALTSYIGVRMAGKQATIRDFFLGGRKLSWYAVCGSNIATEISAVTFVGVPAIVFAPEGNFTYLQLGVFGSLLARLIVALVFVPVYYQREIYSPYDYMANQLGNTARTVTTCLFILGGSLAQGARVYLTALILDLLVGQPLFGRLAATTGTETLTWSIYTIGLISVVWTYLGGITTVIWTDVILFLVFLIGAVISLAAVIYRLPGGFGELVATGLSATHAGQGPYMVNWGKFTFFDFNPSPAQTYTIWTAVIASTWGGLGAYGTDQMMAQRIFCCRNARHAKAAIIGSTASQLITIMMMLVGVGLYVFYQRYPLDSQAASLVAKTRDYIFPIFIIQQLPQGLTGLVIAGIFAAAISTLIAVIASFSQTTLSAFYLPWRVRRLQARGQAVDMDALLADRRLVAFSRILVIVWGVVLCLTAQLAQQATSKYPEILNLALSMAGYAGGALLAGFMLAFLKLNVDARGFVWSAPLSVFVVFAIAWHAPWAQRICLGGGIVLVATWLISVFREMQAATATGENATAVLLPRRLAQTLLLIFGVVAMICICRYGYFDSEVRPDGKVHYTTLAWPWFTPVGSLVAFVFGYLLGRPRPSPVPDHPPRPDVAGAHG